MVLMTLSDRPQRELLEQASRHLRGGETAGQDSLAYYFLMSYISL